MAAGIVITEEISTAASNYSYAKAGDRWLQGIEVTSDEAQEVSVGTTNGGAEIDGPLALDAGQVWTIKGGKLTSFASQTIYFSGLAGNVNIKIWMLGI